MTLSTMAGEAVMSEGAVERPAPVTEVHYTLLFPVELKNRDGQVVERIASLTLRRLKGSAARACLNAHAKGAGDFAQELVCAAAGIPPSTFAQLDAEDVLALVERAAPFLGSGLPTR